MALLPLLAAGNATPPTARRGSPWSSAVINITSISGIVKVAQNHYAYNASKASANSLTLMLAHELNFSSKINVRVNALAPGLFASEMTAGGAASKDGVTDPSSMGDHSNPAGRTGDAEEMVRDCFRTAEMCSSLPTPVVFPPPSHSPVLSSFSPPMASSTAR